MATFVIGTFPDMGRTQKAVDVLKGTGFMNEELSVLVKDNSAVGAESGQGGVTAGAVTGASTGGVLGALAGLLVGIGVLAIPGVGPLLAGGPLLASLGISGAAASTAVGAAAGAATGAVAGGLAGALVKRGVPEEEAMRMEMRLKEGGVLLGVTTDRLSSDTAADILRAQGAESISQLA